VGLHFIIFDFIIIHRSVICNDKKSVKRLRPCHEPEIATNVILIKNKCGGKYSFVSSHATNCTGFAVLAWLLLKPFANKKWKNG